MICIRYVGVSEESITSQRRESNGGMIDEAGMMNFFDFHKGEEFNPSFRKLYYIPTQVLFP